MGDCFDDVIIECPLSALWPHPYLFRLQNRNTLVAFASKWALENKVATTLTVNSESVDSGIFSSLHKEAYSCLENERFELSHPLRLAAAVHFSDGSTETAWQLKGLEYGCTLDPVSQLLSFMERRRTQHKSSSSFICQKCTIDPVDSWDNKTVFSDISIENSIVPSYIVMTDQFGICHAPFAQARSLLTEHGYGNAKILVHDVSGVLVVVKASELLPLPPGNAKLLSHDDFV